jgi:hypothetical protein
MPELREAKIAERARPNAAAAIAPTVWATCMPCGTSRSRRNEAFNPNKPAQTSVPRTSAAPATGLGTLLVHVPVTKMLTAA